MHALPAPIDVIAASNPVFMVIDGFRYGMIGQADGSLLFGGSILLALNITLAAVCFYILKSGYRLKS